MNPWPRTAPPFKTTFSRPTTIRLFRSRMLDFWIGLKIGVLLILSTRNRKWEDCHITITFAPCFYILGQCSHWGLCDVSIPVHAVRPWAVPLGILYGRQKQLWSHAPRTTAVSACRLWEIQVSSRWENPWHHNSWCAWGEQTFFFFSLPWKPKHKKCECVIWQVLCMLAVAETLTFVWKLDMDTNWSEDLWHQTAFWASCYQNRAQK